MGLLKQALLLSGNTRSGGMEVKQEYRAIFAEESVEHLQEWEVALLALERDPRNEELIHTLFRAIHTLKGSAGFIGFDKLQRLAHQLESALQAVRDGSVALKGTHVSLLFRGLDLARAMVESFSRGKEFLEEIEPFLAQLRSCAAQGGDVAGNTALPAEPTVESPVECAGNPPSPSPSGAGKQEFFEVELSIGSRGREAFLRAFLVRNRLAGLATILSEDPAPELLRDSLEPFAYRMRLETCQGEKELRAALNIDLLNVLSLRRLDKAGSQATASGPEGQADTALATPGESGSTELKVDEVVRVSVDRLDTLLNLVGELVIQNSGFISIAQELKEHYGKKELIGELETKTEGLSKIIRDLQDGIMKVRMLPVRNVFNRFYRVVRDLSKLWGKEITLDVFGQDTEIDKKVMDRIADPLVHLVRNAIDHGIESREKRLAAGKATVGVVRLGAYQDGDHICIEVSDDGRGLDREAILRKALEEKLIHPQEAERLDDESLLGLIFLPGFSTAREVSEVSGRGVGMDVVKRAIQGMSGTIRIRSAVGRGTTVTVSLPLTMAIIPALLIEVGGTTLAVPLSSVTEVLKVEETELHSIGLQPMIRLREEVIPLVPLQKALELLFNGNRDQRAGERTPVVIVEHESRRIGLGVQRVLGSGEIVIKSLSRHYREIEGLIGASILGNGRIALIVDVESLVRRYHQTDGGKRSLSGQAIFNYQAAATPTAQAVSAPGESFGTDSGGEGRMTAPEVRPGSAPPASSVCDLVASLESPGSRFLEEIHNAGAIQASMSLSRLTGREIRVSFPESRLVPLGDVAELLGGEEQATGGIYIGLDGELVGGILVVLPVQDLLRFHDFLYRSPDGSCTSLEAVDLSGISELANILCASFINAISDQTGLEIKPNGPEVIVDMCLSVLDSVLSRFNQPGEQFLFTKARVFSNDSKEVSCHLLMFLEPESFIRLLDRLTGRS